MRRSSTSSLVAGIAIAMAMASAALAQRAPATGVRALANVRELHDIMISPASDAVFDATSQQSLDEKGWTAARNQALVLAESANLLMLGTRVRDNGNWMKMSRALVDAAAAARGSVGSDRDRPGDERADGQGRVGTRPLHHGARRGRAGAGRLS